MASGTACSDGLSKWCACARTTRELGTYWDVQSQRRRNKHKGTAHDIGHPPLTLGPLSRYPEDLKNQNTPKNELDGTRSIDKAGWHTRHTVDAKSIAPSCDRRYRAKSSENGDAGERRADERCHGVELVIIRSSSQIHVTIFELVSS